MSDWTPPRQDEIEVCLLGPGYGECCVIHVGDCDWFVVDSFRHEGTAVALRYLRKIGIDPKKAVKLIAASHWHDDHIGGMGELVRECTKARFCCAAALRSDEFLSAVGGLLEEDRDDRRSGLREFRTVFTHLARMQTPPSWATSGRRILRTAAGCEIWSLSPSDVQFNQFLSKVFTTLWSTRPGSSKRVRELTPNELSVVLWVQCGDTALLLGGDLEKRGWLTILQDEERPRGRASVFKVPHHGSANADLPKVWHRMLAPNPFALVAPWRLGNLTLPRANDVTRILGRTPNAYATAKSPSSMTKRHGMVGKSLREAGVQTRSMKLPMSMVRLRRSLRGSDSWQVDTIESSCHLSECVA